MPNESSSRGASFGGGVMSIGENRVLIEASEAPFDAPSEPGITRIGCASARFDANQRLKIPANGVIELTVGDFYDVGEFDPRIHCVTPDL